MSDRAEPGRSRASSVDVDCPPGSATSSAVTTQASRMNVCSPGGQASLERAVDHTPTADWPVRARLLATLAEELGWSDQHERRQDLADEA